MDFSIHRGPGTNPPGILKAGCTKEYKYYDMLERNQGKDIKGGLLLITILLISFTTTASRCQFFNFQMRTTSGHSGNIRFSQ